MFNANKYYMGFSLKTKFYIVSYVYNGRFLYFIENTPNNDKEIALANDDKEKFLKKYRKRSVLQLKKAHSCKHKETHLFFEKELHNSPYAELHYHYCDECGSVDIRKTIHDKEKYEAVINLKFANASLDETEQEIKELKEKIEKLEKEKICYEQNIETLEKILQS